MRRSEGTLHGLRKQLPWTEGRPFRILSIDGGGIRGILPAKILAELEQRYCDAQPIGHYFDLIARTSTGAIIALGLASGMTAQSILDLYLSHGQEVFPRSRTKIGRSWSKLRSLGYYAYDPAPLRGHLTRIFGDRLIGDTTRRLCVPTFDGFTEVNIFKTPHHEDYRRDWKESVVTAGMATAAAPTFFPVYKDKGRVFADGGVWSNNPVMIGLTDALACYQIKRRQVHILSLGSGDTDIRITRKQILRGGIWHWRDIILSAMHLQSQNASGQAGLLIGRDQLIRLNAPPMPENPIELDDFVRAHEELPEIALALVNDNGELISERFLFGMTEPYQAFYGPRA